MCECLDVHTLPNSDRQKCVTTNVPRLGYHLKHCLGSYSLNRHYWTVVCLAFSSWCLTFVDRFKSRIQYHPYGHIFFQRHGYAMVMLVSVEWKSHTLFLESSVQAEIILKCNVAFSQPLTWYQVSQQRADRDQSSEDIISVNMNYSSFVFHACAIVHRHILDPWLTCLSPNLWYINTCYIIIIVDVLNFKSVTKW